ncbi:MAG: hypothetical protein AAGC55_26525, partial [Myxococcota bacterium]
MQRNTVKTFEQELLMPAPWSAICEQLEQAIDMHGGRAPVAVREALKVATRDVIGQVEMTTRDPLPLLVAFTTEAADELARNGAHIEADGLADRFSGIIAGERVRVQ